MYENLDFISPMCESLIGCSEENKNISKKQEIENFDKRKLTNFTLRVLSNDNLNDLFELQHEVIEELDTKGHSNFIIKKTKEDFKNLINGTDGKTVGIFDKSEKLVGKVSIKLKNLKEVLCDFKEGTNETKYNPPQLDCLGVDYCIFEVSGIMTHPNYRGMGLSKCLNKFLIDNIEKLSGFKDIILLQEVALENEPNIHVLTVMGFKALQKYTASDGVECYLFYKPINKNLEELTNFYKVISMVDEKSKTMGV